MTENEMGRSPDPETEDGKPHGPLIGFSYDYSSHGMTAGSSAFGGDSVTWNEDGSVVLTVTSNGQGRRTEQRYRVTPELAQTLRDYVAKHRLAALAEKKIELPLVYDCFTSTSITMTFDSRSVGGSVYDRRTIQCGAMRMTFATLENEIAALLKQCRETGSFLGGETRETDGAPGMLGFLYSVAPGSLRVAAGSGAVPAPIGTQWICACGYTENTGKFCAECGKPRPAQEEDGRWTCPNCKTAGNSGNFCAECGTRRPI